MAKIKVSSVFKKLTALGLTIFLTTTGGTFFAKNHSQNILSNDQPATESNNPATESNNPVEENLKLAPSSSVETLAKMYDVEDILAKDGDEYVRFECVKGEPINVIVDENSPFCMTDANIQAIKNTVDDFNELFSYINPDYTFRYISKNDYEKNPDDNPCVFISSQLSINSVSGLARAVTSPPTPEDSKYGNGRVSRYATMFLSSTALIKFDVEQITSIVKHEFAHALCTVGHKDDKFSIMNPVGRDASVASSEFSADAMYAMLAMYYNRETNPHSIQEILSYIRETDAIRNSEIVNAGFSREDNKDKEEIVEQDTILNLYISKLNNYAENNNVEIGEANNAVGNLYTSVSAYGQITAILLNPNGTYSIKIVNADGTKFDCQGSYKIENNVIVCDGEYVSVVDGERTIVDERLFISVLSDNSIAMGTASGNGVITTTLSQTEMGMGQ